jgi:tetratricopeptide (TPR) repeat protein
MATSAVATVPEIATDPASTYVAARAASIGGEHAQAAELFAQLAATSKDTDVSEQAVHEAIRAGNFALALQLVSNLPQASRSIDARLLMVADALRKGQSGIAQQWLGGSGEAFDLSFWKPLLQAWDEAERGNAAAALSTMAAVPKRSALAPFVDEETALILLKFGRTVQADAYARRAIAEADSREFRVRLALATAFKEAGDQKRATAMIDGIDGDSAVIRRELEAGRLKSARIDTAAKAFSEQLIALTLELRRAHVGSTDPVDIIQVARFASPENSDASIVLGVLLDDAGATDKALEALRSVPTDDPLKNQALDAEARSLTGAKRFDEALTLSQAQANARGATADDFARLGDVLSAMKRYDEAAAAYSQAIDRSAGQAKGRMWPLLLLRASALESGNRWPEAKQALNTALGIAPDEPQVLNFLGYADLEHGEDLATAEALIRKASELAPDEPSITDSLGWAQYKRGDVDAAIATLQKAAAGDPAESDIQEHLGDALYSAGMRFEARFAWRAALATADDDDQARLQKKIEIGLNSTTAAR